MEALVPVLRKHAWVAHLVFAITAVTMACVGCHTTPPVDMQPLYGAGMGYDTVDQMKALKVTASEVSGLVAARQAGFSDAACLQVLQLYRARNEAFDSGETIAGLIGAGASENLVLDLARLNQLGLSAGELEAMRLAGLSDQILLAEAQHRAASQPVLSGASLATMKNLGMRSDTLLQLVQRSVPDSQAAQIVAARRHGAKDVDILREFARS
jgi:hypothetical protein